MRTAGKKTSKKSTPKALARRLVGGKISHLATYADLFERMTDAIFLLDPESHHVLECNPSALRALSSATDSIEGSSLGRWLHSDSKLALTDTLLASALRSEPSEAMDVKVSDALGAEHVWELSICRLKLGDYCEVLQVIAKDVSAARATTQELERANQALARLSTLDEMTGLYNFRHLQGEMKKEHERAVRLKTPYSVILCDVDHFKHYNDRNGHPEGDEALRIVAKALRTRARNMDLVTRYGGEEFVVLCPGVDAAAAEHFAEALRKSVEDSTFAHGTAQPLGKLTISLGVASFPAHGASPEAVLKGADQALYRSKDEGRNRTSVQGVGASKKAA